jgi:LysM repeat protein
MHDDDEAYLDDQEPLVKSSLGAPLTAPAEADSGSPQFVPIAIALAGILLGGMALFLNLTGSGKVDTAHTAAVDLDNQLRQLQITLSELREEIDTLEDQLVTVQGHQRTLARDTQSDIDRMGTAIRQNREALAQANQTFVQLATGARVPAPQPQVDVPPRPPVASGSSTPVPAAPSAPAPPVAAQPQVHVVQSGDTLSSIAQRYGVNLAALMQANPEVSPKRMQVGMQIQLP